MKTNFTRVYIVAVLIVITITFGLFATSRAASGQGSPNGEVELVYQFIYPTGEALQVFPLTNGAAAVLLRMDGESATGIGRGLGVWIPGGDAAFAELREGAGQISAAACGKYIYAVVEYADGPLAYYQWELTYPVATCQAYKVYLPKVQ